MKNEEIYKKIDSGINENRRDVVDYIKTRRGKNGKKYKYFSQFIFMEYKERTADSIRKEFLYVGIKHPPSMSNIWVIKDRVMDYVEAKNPENKKVKMCRRCKKKPVKDGNTLFCGNCQEVNNKRARTIETDVYCGASPYIGA